MSHDEKDTSVTGTVTKIKGVFRRSITVKFLFIGFILLLCQIPVAMIGGLRSGREARSLEVKDEIASKWGLQQELRGPLLSIPLHRETLQERTLSSGEKVKKSVRENNSLQFVPDNLEITATMEPEIRYRGIYEVLLYHSRIKMKGAFTPAWDLASEQEWQPDFAQAQLLLGIRDIKGITSVECTFNGEKRKTVPGTAHFCIPGVSVHLPEIADAAKRVQTPIPFEIELELNGCESLLFYPVARVTSLAMDSAWATPSFTGGFLPQTREVTQNGFSAEWIVNDFNRNCPAAWRNNEFSFQDNQSVGVALLKPINAYSLVHRAISYDLLVYVIVLLALLTAERVAKCWVHPLQYLVAGLSLVLFYMLLLSLSEHISFNVAYLASAAIIALLGGFYARLIFGKGRFALAMIATTLCSYAVIFFILQLEDYALLAGSIVLIALMAVLMGFTGKLNSEKS